MTFSIKQQAPAFYTSALALVTGIVAIILYIVCSTGGYYSDTSPAIIVFLILGLIGICGAAVFGELFPSIKIGRLAVIIPIVFFMLAFVMLIFDRVLSIGFLLFSNLGSEHPMAYTNLYQSITAMVFILISVVAMIVGSFFKYKKA